jgi:hypothetical protein
VHIGSFIPNLLGGSTYEGVIHVPGLPQMYGKWHWNALASDYMLRLEFNPSDFYRNSGIELCPFNWIGAICKHVLQMIVNHIDPEVRYSFQKDKDSGELLADFPDGWESDVLVQVLDIAQDFLVTDSRFSMEDLKYLKPKWKRGLANFLRGKRVQTVTHPSGPDSSTLKIYDKYAERESNPKPGAPTLKVGHTRFEVHMPAAELKAHRLNRLANLRDPKLNALLEEYWELSTWGTPMVSKYELFKAMQAAGLSDELSALAFTYLYFKDMGINPPLSDRKLRRIRKTLTALDMKQIEGLEQSSYAYGYLDFKTGELVASGPGKS